LIKFRIKRVVKRKDSIKLKVESEKKKISAEGKNFEINLKSCSES